MINYFRVPITWPQVVKRTLKEIRDDNCFGLAAQLAFYFLLAVFPALIFFVALTGFVPVENALNTLLAGLGTVAPQGFVRLLRVQLAQLAAGTHTSALTLGIIGAIWSSSAGMAAIIDALNRAYDVTEWRPWWRRRLLAVFLTVALVLFIIVALTLFLVGPALAFRLASWFGFRSAIALLWTMLRWPVILFCIVFTLNLVYHYAPNRPSRWVWVTPGSLLATALWIIVSVAFKAYVTNFGNYTATYGAIGGAIVAMLWFYVSSVAILIGAELNGVIEQAWRSASPGAAG
jgi:membrane protein